MERKRLRILKTNLSVNQQKDTGGSVNSCCSNLKMYTLQETGEILRRQPRWCQRMMGNRDLWVRAMPAKCLCLRTSSTAESYQCEPQTPRGAPPGMDGRKPTWQPLDWELLLSPAAPGCGAREALCTGVVACVQAPSDFKRRWPCWYP